MNTPFEPNSIISEEELTSIYEEMVLKSRNTRFNPYEIYIEECKLTKNSKVDAQGKKLFVLMSYSILFPPNKLFQIL